MIVFDMLIRLIYFTRNRLVFFLLLLNLFWSNSFANENLEIEIDNPRFSEKGLDNRLYEIKAERGIQKKNNLELYIIEGKLRTESGIWIYLNADKGNFNQQDNSIILSGAITFYTEENEKLQSDNAFFSINNDIIKFDENVKHTRGSSVITADTSTIKNNFEHILYEGNVNSLYVVD